MTRALQSVRGDMNKLLGLSTAFVLACSGVAHALQRGDTGYICYTRHSGWMWIEQDHSCKFVVLEVLGNRYRVEYLETCHFHENERGDVELLDSKYIFHRRCNK